MSSRFSRLWLVALLVLIGLGPQVKTAFAVSLDTERGVFSLASTLEPIMPSVVQIIVRAQAPGAGPGGGQDPWQHQAPQAPGQPYGGPQQPPGGGGPGGQTPSGSTGSGVIVDAERGLILTNHHVVEDGSQITVKLTDGRTMEAEVVGSDESTDVALLKIEPKDLTAIQFGNSEELQVGDIVIAIGYPFGIEQTVTLGIVSGLGRKGVGKDFEDFIQTDAAINFGNSGGALVDSRGHLIGINTAIYSRTGGNVGIGFAVPILMAAAVMDQLLAYGEVRRGRLGVEVRDLTADLAEALGLALRKGALITRVPDDSPGAQAGLQSGDIVVRAADQAVEDSADLRNIIGLSRPDSEVVVVVVRDEEETEVTVSLAFAVAEGAPDGTTLAGASFTALTEDNPMSRFVEGVVVGEVEADSLAARQGLRKGDIVTHINRQEITDLDELGAALGDLGPVTALTVVRGNSEFIVVLENA